MTPPPGTPQPPPPPDTGSRASLRPAVAPVGSGPQHGWLRSPLAWALLGLAAGVLAASAALLAGGGRSAAPAPTVAGAPLRPGPWGEVYRVDLVLEPPGHALDPARCPRTPPRWHFPGQDVVGVDRSLAGAGLPDATRAALLGSTTCGPGECVVVPDRQAVLSLTPGQRDRLEELLGASLANRSYWLPYILPDRQAALWFGDRGVRPETLELVRALSRRVGDSLRLAEVNTVCASLPTDDERRAFLRMLGRVPAVVLTVRVPEGGDVEALARYWERGRAPGTLRPLLSALARVPGGGTVDVAELLPHYARAHLDRYPQPGEDGRDCHYAALNFASATPVDAFPDDAAFARAYQSAFEVVPLAEATFGDVLLVTRGGASIHAVAYVADDVVFSKNGGLATSPWVLMRLRDVTDRYPGTVTALRRKPG